MTTYSGWPEAQVYRGRDGIREFFDQWLATWERYEAGVDEYVDAGDDLVVVLTWQRGYTEGASLPVEMRWGMVAKVRDKDYGLRSLIHEVVQSDLFRNK